jgi:hypothetical protein
LSGLEAGAAAGETARIHVSLEQLHFFDPETGAAIGGD